MFKTLMQTQTLSNVSNIFQYTIYFFFGVTRFNFSFSLEFFRILYFRRMFFEPLVLVLLFFLDSSKVRCFEDLIQNLGKVLEVHEISDWIDIKSQGFQVVLVESTSHRIKTFFMRLQMSFKVVRAS